MILAHTLERMRNISPEGRYVLMRLWVEYRHELPLQITIQDFAKKMTISRTRASAIFSELISGGYFQIDSAANRRGRPTRILDISVQTREALLCLDPDQRTTSDHLQPIISVISYRNSKSKKNSQLNLSPSNVTLLVTLLSYANKCGVVRGLSTTKLKLCTGMNFQRMNLQITKLKQLGLLDVVATGITGSQLLGKVTTTYWLNLSAPPLTPPENSRFVREIWSLPHFGATADDLFNLNKHLTTFRRNQKRAFPNENVDKRATLMSSSEFPLVFRKGMAREFDFLLVDGFFSETKNKSLRKALQMAIDRLACEIVASRISSSCKGSKNSIGIVRMRRLYRTFLPVRFQKPGPIDFPSKQHRQMLISLFITFSERLANELDTNLRHAFPQVEKLIAFDLLPARTNDPQDRIFIALERWADPES